MVPLLKAFPKPLMKRRHFVLGYFLPEPLMTSSFFFNFYIVQFHLSSFFPHCCLLPCPPTSPTFNPSPCCPCPWVLLSQLRYSEEGPKLGSHCKCKHFKAGNEVHCLFVRRCQNPHGKEPGVSPGFPFSHWERMRRGGRETVAPREQDHLTGCRGREAFKEGSAEESRIAKSRPKDDCPEKGRTRLYTYERHTCKHFYILEPPLWSWRM